MTQNPTGVKITRSNLGIKICPIIHAPIKVLPHLPPCWQTRGITRELDAPGVGV